MEQNSKGNFQRHPMKVHFPPASSPFPSYTKATTVSFRWDTKAKLLHKGGQLSMLLMRLLEQGLWYEGFQDSIIFSISEGLSWKVPSKITSNKKTWIK